jgi:hypothetical protein
MADDHAAHAIGAYGSRRRHELVQYYGDGLGQPGAGTETRREEWELRRLSDEVGDIAPEDHRRRSPARTR